MYILLLYAEIIKEVKTNGYNLTELLQVPSDQLEPNSLNRALEAAVNNDNHVNIGKLILKGANNIEDCLRQSRDHLGTLGYPFRVLAHQTISRQCSGPLALQPSLGAALLWHAA